MKALPRNILVLTTGLVLGVAISIGHGVFAERQAQEKTALPLEELRAFSEVFARIKTDYVEPVDDKTLLENAISGMLSGLDPHSAYLNAEDFTDLKAGTTGEFGGLGIEVGMENGFVKVISPIDDTPAQRAGVKSGDLIIKLDDTPVKGMTLRDAVNLMRGKPGTSIMLTIVREGQEKPLKISVTRDVIKVQSVKSRMLEPNLGYVRITQFQANTGGNLLDALTKLQKENKGPLQGVVLDLRNNPGGVLNAAVEVSDAFLDNGLVVYTQGRVKDAQLSFKASPGDALKGAPIVVLVNGGSASASEIVAGALQDHRRSIIVGTKTFGKGSVQTILPLTNETALKLTTARYFTPNGRSIQAEGIEPDIELDGLKLASAEQPDGAAFIKEADLTGHLSGGTAKPKKPVPKEDAEGKKNDRLTIAKEDYQLYEALNILKGLIILKK